MAHDPYITLYSSLHTARALAFTSADGQKFLGDIAIYCLNGFDWRECIIISVGGGTVENTTAFGEGFRGGGGCFSSVTPDGILRSIATSVEQIP